MRHVYAVHLTKPGRIDIEAGHQAQTIARHRLRAVIDMIAQIEAVERGQTDPARAGGYARLDLRWRGPVRHQPVIHPMNASRSCLSNDSNQTKSSGSGDSQLMRLPVIG